MKKVLISILFFLPLSSFSADKCDATLDVFARTISSQGGAKIMLEIEEGNASKLRIYQTTFELQPNLSNISGYTRDSLKVVINDNHKSRENLKNNIVRTGEISRQLREIIKENCRS